MDSNTTLAIILVLVALLVIMAAVAFTRNQRRRRLRGQFGAEYDRLVKTLGRPRRAEAELEQRRKRVAGYTLNPLTERDREAFAGEWAHTEAQFVDAPDQAVTHADQLIGRIMAARGYPVSDFERQSADLSVHHPDLTPHYRTAHEIAVRQGKGQASTEDLRQALIHYRGLFDTLAAPPVEGQAVAPYR